MSECKCFDDSMKTILCCRTIGYFKQVRGGGFKVVMSLNCLIVSACFQRARYPLDFIPGNVLGNRHNAGNPVLNLAFPKRRCGLKSSEVMKLLVVFCWTPACTLSTGIPEIGRLTCLPRTLFIINSRGWSFSRTRATTSHT